MKKYECKIETLQTGSNIKLLQHFTQVSTVANGPQVLFIKLSDKIGVFLQTASHSRSPDNVIINT